MRRFTPRELETYNKMLQSKAGKLFANVVRGYNFITPDLIRFEEIPNGALEIASGDRPFAGDTRLMYGVTVVKHSESRDDLSKSFRSRRVMEAYVYGLKKGLWN